MRNVTKILQNFCFSFIRTQKLDVGCVLVGKLCAYVIHLAINIYLYGRRDANNKNSRLWYIVYTIYVGDLLVFISFFSISLSLSRCWFSRLLILRTFSLFDYYYLPALLQTYVFIVSLTTLLWHPHMVCIVCLVCTVGVEDGRFVHCWNDVNDVC